MELAGAQSVSSYEDLGVCVYNVCAMRIGKYKTLKRNVKLRKYFEQVRLLIIIMFQ